MYGLTGEPLQTLYKIVAIFILLGVQLMATARARVRYVTVHMMAPNGPISLMYVGNGTWYLDGTQAPNIDRAMPWPWH